MANYTKKVDGVTITLTDAEQTAREAEEKTAADGKPAKAFASLRLERDIKLSKCDWTVANDTPLSDSVKAKWVTYRKALRDLPASESDPDDITWPDAPS